VPSRKEIVEAARRWLDTPFLHQARIRGVGCDCVGLPLAIGQEFGMSDKNGVPIMAMDESNYDSQPSTDHVHEVCQSRCVEKSIADLQEGDLVSVKMPSVACHLAIIGKLYAGSPDECLSIIHAFSPAGKVVETVLDKHMRTKIKGAFVFGEDE
jgi:hypothetical protein